MRPLKLWWAKAIQSARSRELWNIVLGVLIALAIGEVAEAARWQWRVQAAERAMQVKLGAARANFNERMLTQPCLEQRWRDIDAILRAARLSGELPKIGQIGRSNHRSLASGAWQTTIGEGVLLHMRRDRRERYSGIYERTVIWHGSLREELVAWGKLSALVEAPGPISSDMLADLNDTLYSLRATTILNGALAQQLDRGLGEMGIDAAFDSKTFRGSAALRAAVLARPICKPLMVNDAPFVAPDRPELALE